MQNEPNPKRRRFDEVFKQDAVKLLRQGDKPLKQLAADLGVAHWNLRDWKRRYGPPAPVRSNQVMETELRLLRRENEHLRAQRDILKKNLGHPCRTAAERFARMTPLEAEHALTDLCAAFGVSRAGYHAWKPRPPGARQQTDQTLSLTLCQAHAASRQTYGSPRLLAALRQQGHRTSRRRVRRLMHQHALRTAIPRRFVPQTTASRHAQPIAPNRLAQTPAPTGPNQVWVGDITYVRTDEGWLYVAAVLDRWSRRGVGLAMAEHMESSLVGQALGHALHQRRPAAGCVPHTGRGSQYASGPIGSK